MIGERFFGWFGALDGSSVPPPPPPERPFVQEAKTPQERATALLDNIMTEAQRATWQARGYCDEVDGGTTYRIVRGQFGFWQIERSGGQIYRSRHFCVYPRLNFEVVPPVVFSLDACVATLLYLRTDRAAISRAGVASSWSQSTVAPGD